MRHFLWPTQVATFSKTLFSFGNRKSLAQYLEEMASSISSYFAPVILEPIRIPDQQCNQRKIERRDSPSNVRCGDSGFY